MQDAQTFGLFPTPVTLFGGMLDADYVEHLKAAIDAEEKWPNAGCAELVHTRVYAADRPACYDRLVECVLPRLAYFGSLIFGQELRWSITGIWGNVATRGAHQPRHNHANSIVSGVVYLTDVEAGACTAFHRNAGGDSFSLRNQNENVRYNAYNGASWAPGAISRGDMMLFPSYLLHEVPRVETDRRLTVAFNAVPNELNYSGYVIRLG